MNFQNIIHLSKKITKKQLVLAYIIFLFLGFIYINSVLKQNTVPFSETPKEEKKEVDVRPASVTLKITANNSTTDYRAKRDNEDTIYDLFDYLQNNDSFTYEKIAYTYGTELDFINGIKAPNGYKWKIFINDEDLTFTAADIKLIDGYVYNLVLSKVN